MFKIEKNVPIARGFGRGRPPKYPFNEMEVGDSFVFGSEIYTAVAASAFAHGTRNGTKFSVSKVHGRCWRVK